MIRLQGFIPVPATIGLVPASDKKMQSTTDLQKDPVSDSQHPYDLFDSRTGEQQAFSTLDQAREALLSWILLQRQAGEPVIEHDTGQWSDSRVTRWIADHEGRVVPLESK